MPAVHVRAIAARDLPQVAEFLQRHLNARVSASDWVRSIQVPWATDAPNHGFMLLDGEQVAGVYLAFYSDRVIAGRPEKFCNLGAWCVRPEYRVHSLRLLNALVAQRGYTFTDLSPSGNTIPINRRLRFETLDTATALVPNLPWPSWPGSGCVSADPAMIAQTISGRSLEIYRDHAGTAAAQHLVLTRKGDWCYVVFRKDRRKNLPLFATVLHVSHPALFRSMMPVVSRHLLLRHGALATLAELRVVGGRPWPSMVLNTGRPKMFRSASVLEDQIDYLYSELACVRW